MLLLEKLHRCKLTHFSQQPHVMVVRFPVIHSYSVTRSHISFGRLLVRKDKEKTKERKTKCFSQSNTTSRSLLLQVHTVTPRAARHTPASPEQRHLQRFPHLKLTLFYYGPCGIANIHNPSTSVKYLLYCCIIVIL